MTEFTTNPLIGRAVQEIQLHRGAGPNGASTLVPLLEWDAGKDVDPIPPRQWLLGNTFCRTFISGLLADGATGKTSLRCAQFLSLATGRELTGEYVFQRCRVLVVCMEDDRNEIRRRLRAAQFHYGIKPEEIREWLYVSTPPAECGKLLTLDHAGRPIPGGLIASIEDAIVRLGVDLVSLDPLLKSHGVDENSNVHMDALMNELSALASRRNIAIDILHHTSKGSDDPGNAQRGRGASSVNTSARLVNTMNVMGREEAQRFNISEQARKRYVRVDHAKVNLAPAPEEATWFELIGVRLGNGTDLYLAGDEVQTVQRWTPPNVWRDLNVDLLNRILDDLDAGLDDGNLYTDAPKAKDRAAWRVVVRHAPDKTEHEARRIITTWVKNDVLQRTTYHSPDQRRNVTGLCVNPEKRPS